MENRCVNLDWLEVFCIELQPCDEHYFTNLGYEVKVRDYGTPMYAEMFTLMKNGIPFIEVRRKPYSLQSNGGIFPDGACHLRLSNRMCYTSDPIWDLRQFLIDHNYQYMGISRVDICMDFIKFDRNDDPRGFLKAYFAGKYAKINQCNIAAHGKDMWNGQMWNSVRWGSNSSMVSTKMYLKTLEMEETGNKKGYIVEQWKQAGLAEYQIVYRDMPNGKRNFFNIVTQCDKSGNHPNRDKAIPYHEAKKCDVWRVEFSIKTEGRNWIDMTNGKQHELNLSTIENRGKLLFLFHALAHHYFHFKRIVKKENGEPQRKDRCPDKVLFVTSKDESAYKPHQFSTKRDSTRMDRIIMGKLYDISQDYDNTTQKERNAAYTLAKKIENEIMQTWGAEVAERIRKLADQCPF